MPHRIFHIISVHLLVALELLYSIFVFPGVVVCQTALPMIGVTRWHPLDLGIPARDRFFKTPRKEMILALLVEFPNRQLIVEILRRRIGNEKCGHKNTHSCP